MEKDTKIGQDTAIAAHIIGRVLKENPEANLTVIIIGAIEIGNLSLDGAHDSGNGHKATLTDKRLIVQALREAQGSQREAAKILGCSRWGLKKAIDRFGGAINIMEDERKELS